MLVEAVVVVDVVLNVMLFIGHANIQSTTSIRCTMLYTSLSKEDMYNQVIETTSVVFCAYLIWPLRLAV